MFMSLSPKVLQEVRSFYPNRFNKKNYLIRNWSNKKSRLSTLSQYFIELWKKRMKKGEMENHPTFDEEIKTLTRNL